MTDIVAFIRARLDEDEWWAREASRPRDGAPPAEGVHWHWVDGETDEPLTMDPMLGDELNDGGRADLRSVEEFPTRSVGLLPLFPVSYAQEVSTVAAAHIARHDPARVLREVTAKRRVLAAVERWRDPHPGLDCTNDDDPWAPCELHAAATGRLDPYVLVLLAGCWSDHPDYDQAWAVMT